METGSLIVPFLDPGTKPDDDTSLAIWRIWKSQASYAPHKRSIMVWWSRLIGQRSHLCNHGNRCPTSSPCVDYPWASHQNPLVYLAEPVRKWSDFLQCPLLNGVVVLKGLIFNNFQFGRMWGSCKYWFWICFSLGGHGSLEINDFGCFYIGDVVFLKELIFHNVHFWTVWWSWNDWFSLIFNLGGCGGVVRTDSG